VARLTRLARVGARSGFSLLAGGDSNAAAEQAVEILGNMRGMAAKLGQMASYIDGIVPDAQRDTYERVLARLRSATANSPFPKVRATIEHELGGSLAELFAEFEPEPIASASIGQVHRARLQDGREVAVKVQHPGIGRAVEADLGSAGALASLMSLAGPRGVNVREIHNEVADRFREELDYRLEAQRQTLFRSFYLNEPQIHVPAVIETHTTSRVLTSELVRGRDFAAIVSAPEAERAHYAALLWRFVFRAILVEGVFNADPHPGNYLFHDDGSISFLDFGCVQVLDAETHEGSRGMHASAIANDEKAFREAAARVSRTKPGPFETDLLGYLWRCFDVLKTSPYRFERSYVADIVRSTQGMKKHLLDKKANITAPPSGVMLLNRLQFGFYSVLARLDAAVDYAAIERELLAEAPRSPPPKSL
jgi:predicted unusual protein kinase regulating ubiquinone biosynthesis (AarF/ABC1/UbiB family)